MTYQNDPNINRKTAIDRRTANESWGSGSIILASLAALAVVFGLFYAMSNSSDSSLANRNENRPATTTTTNVPPANRATTGSGVSTQNPDSTGSKPVMPGQVPAPASPPAANR